MKDQKIELPAEFNSGNNVPVTQATIKRERMEEILQDAIEATCKRRGEPVKETSDLVKQLRIKAAMITMGEEIAWGSDVELMQQAAQTLERYGAAQPSVPDAAIHHAPEILNTNDRAMWCLGWNACREVMIRGQK